MSARTQQQLDLEQKRIYKTLRGFHDQSPDRHFVDTVTAIVATVADGSQVPVVSSRIFLFGGLLIPCKGNCLLRGDRELGVIVSVHWLFNGCFRETLGKNPHNQGWFSHCAVDQDSFDTLLWGASNQVLQFADEDQKIELEILANSQLIFQAKPRMQYSLNIHLRNKTYKHSMEFRVQTSPHCVVGVGCSEYLALHIFAEGAVGQREETKTNPMLSVREDR